MDRIEELLRDYQTLRSEIESRISHFEELWRKGSEHDLFKEAVFCLFTPQSKAVSCWRAVELLDEGGLIYEGEPEAVSETIRGLVRFHRVKAENLVLLRQLFVRNGSPCIREIIGKFPDARRARRWLVENVRGYGLKEASHFLRNIGFGLDLAIVDRHILRCMKDLGIIEKVPGNLSYSRYLEIESLLKEFSSKVGIPFAHLDLLFWAKKVGFVFK